jgi:hypothetical protein
LKDRHADYNTAGPLSYTLPFDRTGTPREPL